jgi:hypothetical protein
MEDEFPLGQSCMEKPKPFGQLQWRIDSTRRAFHRALHALQQLEAAPAPAPPVAPDPPPALNPPSLPPSPQTTSPQIGFVPSTPAAAEGTDQTDMDFRRSLPEIRCQSGLSPVSHPAPQQPPPRLRYNWI